MGCRVADCGSVTNLIQNEAEMGVNIPFSAFHNHGKEKSISNTCFLFGDVKLHRFYFLLLDNLPEIVLMFKSQREG